MQLKKKVGIVQMIVCATLWSIAGIFIKLIPWNAFVIAGWRSFISAVTVAIFLLIKKQPVKFTKRAVINGIFMCLTFNAFVLSNKLTTSANAIVLQFTAPVFILILSAIFLKQRFRKADIYVVSITLFGIALFFFDKIDTGRLVGNLVAVSAGLFMAIMYMLIGGGDDSDSYSGMLLGHLFTAIIGIPVMFFIPTPFTTTAVVSILTLGIFQLGIPYILFVLASRTCPPLACSLIGAIEPLLNPIWVLIFDGEKPGIFALIGGIIVITVITLWCVYNNKNEAT